MILQWHLNRPSGELFVSAFVLELIHMVYVVYSPLEAFNDGF